MFEEARIPEARFQPSADSRKDVTTIHKLVGAARPLTLFFPKGTRRIPLLSSLNSCLPRASSPTYYLSSTLCSAIATGRTVTPQFDFEHAARDCERASKAPCIDIPRSRPRRAHSSLSSAQTGQVMAICSGLGPPGRVGADSWLLVMGTRRPEIRLERASGACSSPSMAWTRKGCVASTLGAGRTLTRSRQHYKGNDPLQLARVRTDMLFSCALHAGGH